MRADSLEIYFGICLASPVSTATQGGVAEAAIVAANMLYYTLNARSGVHEAIICIVEEEGEGVDGIKRVCATYAYDEVYTVVAAAEAAL